MRLEARKLLHDIESAITLIEQFTSGRTYPDYEQDAMLRSAVDASSPSSVKGWRDWRGPSPI